MKNNGGIIRVISAILLTCMLASSMAEATDPLTFSVATDKSAYVAGELLITEISAHNPNVEDIILWFGSSRQAYYTMDSTYTSPRGGYSVITSATIPAQSSYTWNVAHDWAAYDLTLGSHSVVGIVGNAGSSPANTFDIISQTLPTSDVFIDFETLPDGRVIGTSGGLDHEYVAWGVHFGKIKNGAEEFVPIHADGNNHYVGAGSTSYPPGFNIFAEFDMEVYGVSANVSSAVGQTITMIARDSNGVFIDSVVSDVVTSGWVANPVTLQSQTPIASVEWWPAAQNAYVMVDNLYLTIPEPASLSLLAIGGLAVLRRRQSS